ncbi:hypothetical protein LSM04_009519 [Trypanosoma melophagium]|uniref:uncharacterized protein n=1 Tax=Trypanosoma melophagium TaxID=715481 RepID=UPI003519F3E4|nr:hypothetical protein LSM04_009519 [Trypanosoma melophagium]
MLVTLRGTLSRAIIIRKDREPPPAPLPVDLLDWELHLLVTQHTASNSFGLAARAAYFSVDLVHVFGRQPQKESPLMSTCMSRGLKVPNELERAPPILLLLRRSFHLRRPRQDSAFRSRRQGYRRPCLPCSGQAAPAARGPPNQTGVSRGHALDRAG